MSKNKSPIHFIQISELQNRKIELILKYLLDTYQSPEDLTFLQKARLYANQLPFNILENINDFRVNEKNQRYLLIRELNCNDLEKTPNTVGKNTDVLSGIKEGFLMILVASYLGDVFGWSSQRDGALINNIIPVKNHEKEQLSTGSSIELDWHTEEAFHPFRSDFVGLFCLRNIDHVPTILGSIDSVDLDPKIKKILFEERFTFLTDKNFNSNEIKKPISVLFGDFDSPYLRIDPSFMKTEKEDKEAQQALDYIIKKVKDVLFELVLKPGDFIIFDNYKMVHGRKAFKPKYNGYDRWLKRVNITLDIRKSKGMRKSSYIIQANQDKDWF